MISNRKIRRGDVYYCDFGKPIGSVQRGKRPCVIIQNNDGNANAPTVIVIPFTSQPKKSIPPHFEFLPIDYMTEYFIQSEGGIELTKTSIILCEQIITVDKIQMKSYLGRMSKDFMNILNQKIGISIDIPIAN